MRQISLLKVTCALVALCGQAHAQEWSLGTGLSYGASSIVVPTAGAGEYFWPPRSLQALGSVERTVGKTTAIRLTVSGGDDESRQQGDAHDFVNTTATAALGLRKEIMRKGAATFSLALDAGASWSRMRASGNLTNGSARAFAPFAMTSAVVDYTLTQQLGLRFGFPLIAASYAWSRQRTESEPPIDGKGWVVSSNLEPSLELRVHF